MSTLPRDLVAFALQRSAELPALAPADWDRLVREARRADLLARIAGRLDQQGLLENVPSGPRGHLQAALRVAAAQQREVEREIRHIVDALAPIAVSVTLLKGAAYVAARLPASLGRTFADIDILVPHNRLAEVESALMLCGWATTHHSPYDQRYYREWMHELPPLRHVTRGTVLDVHHAILPLTARLRPSSELLLAAARSVDGWPGVQVLMPVDMVLHGATHLFHNEELSHGLRDLSDLDALLRHFGPHAGFWEALADRSRQLDLAQPLAYGLRYAHRFLGTPVQPRLLAAADGSAHRGPGARLLNGVWQRALRTDHSPGTAPVLTRAALFVVYVRAHWLRMPPLLLARHLAIKALRPSSDGAASKNAGTR